MRRLSQILTLFEKWKTENCSLRYQFVTLQWVIPFSYTKIKSLFIIFHGKVHFKQCFSARLKCFVLCKIFRSLLIYQGNYFKFPLNKNHIFFNPPKNFIFWPTNSGSTTKGAFTKHMHLFSGIFWPNFSLNVLHFIHNYAFNSSFKRSMLFSQPLHDRVNT